MSPSPARNPPRNQHQNTTAGKQCPKSTISPPKGAPPRENVPQNTKGKDAGRGKRKGRHQQQMETQPRLEQQIHSKRVLLEWKQSKRKTEKGKTRGRDWITTSKITRTIRSEPAKAHHYEGERQWWETR